MALTWYTIKDWMDGNFLQINTNKTEILIIAPDSIASKVVQCTGPLSSSSSVKVNLKNLGVIFDQAIFLSNINLLTCSCFCHLRNITKLNSVVSRAELEM